MKRLYVRAVWIAAAILVVAFVFSTDVVTTEEKAQMELAELSFPLSNAASFAADCERRIANKDQPGSYLRRQDLAACEAGFQKFTELFESSSDEVVAKICASNGYLSLKSKDTPVFDKACKSRNNL